MLKNEDSATPVFEREISDVYDLFYSGRGQDFAAEAATVATTILTRAPDATSVLDVACGTGEHLRTLATWFDDLTGLDISHAMCDVSRGKVPQATIHQGDMRTLDLCRTFDSIYCLTSSIGYMSDLDELSAAVGAMMRHLTPGGVLVIDPYWTPDAFLDRYIAHDIVRDDTRTVARISHSKRDGHFVRHEAHYLVADTHGIRHFKHAQRLTLFTHTQYLGVLERAGFGVEHIVNEAFAARGLFVGVRRR